MWQLIRLMMMNFHLCYKCGFEPREHMECVYGFVGTFPDGKDGFGYDKIDGQTHLAKTKQFIS